MAEPMRTLDPVSDHVEYATYHLYFLSIHIHLKACVYIEKIQVTRVIFHGIPLRRVAELVHM